MKLPRYSTKWRNGEMVQSKRVLLKSDGRMTIPQEIRKKLELQEGSLLDVEIYGDDKILMTVLRR